MKELFVYFPDGKSVEYHVGEKTRQGTWSGTVSDIQLIGEGEVRIHYENGANLVIGGLPYHFFEKLELSDDDPF